MDSLTQITLGAAVGEIVLGKKAGNRAMLWGAVAGTIPDLDIIANGFLDDVTAVAVAHRGYSHSFFFATLAPPVFAWLVYQFYQKKVDRSPIFKSIIFGVSILLSLLLLYSIIARPLLTGESPSMVLSIVISLTVFWLLRRTWNYWQQSLSRLGEEPSWRDWSWLFFWGIFTHPILDCFTGYGTQVFLPFSDYRVAFNVISVADPIYTVPFLVCLIYASTLLRQSTRRRFLSWLGIGLSSAYMLFAVFNKWTFDAHFEKSLAHHKLHYSRYMSTPTIFNQFLWMGVAESDKYYYYGLQSMFDKAEFIQIDSLYKNKELLGKWAEHPDIKTLKWFSNDYFNVMYAPNNEIVYNDVRFGIIGNLQVPKDTTHFVFQFFMSEKDGELIVDHRRDLDRDFKNDFGTLFKRAMGE